MTLMRDVSGIYQIVNTVSRKAYIGSALNFRKRMNVHLSVLRNGKHHSRKLQSSWDKHGEGVFWFALLEPVEDASALIAREQWWIDKALTFGDDLYNISLTAGSTLGIKMSEATKGKIRARHVGKKLSAETRARMSEAQRGKTRTAEQREKNRLSQIGKVIPLETRARMSASARARVARTGEAITRRGTRSEVDK